MHKELRKISEIVYYIPYDNSAINAIQDIVATIRKCVDGNHLLRSKDYLIEVAEIERNIGELSFIKSNEDKLLQKGIQRKIARLSRRILDENKKIFVVHGRSIAMRDRVCSLLGRLKLDYVILESEHNNGRTIIEKFLSNAEKCGYAVVLFSGDDVGKFNQEEDVLKPRPRQNVILELGYFLGAVGRKNITILHETDVVIERPSDFDGIVYEPFDSYGAWKSKLIKEMKNAGIYIDPSLADRI